MPPDGAPDDLPPEGALNDLPPDGALNVLPPDGGATDLPPEGTLNVLPPDGGLILFRLKIDVEPFLTPGERKCPALGAPIPANVLPWNRSTGSILKTL